MQFLQKFMPLLLVGGFVGGASADCLDEAAEYQSVDPHVLRAIAFNESGMREDAINKNSNGTIDIGLMGINSIHLAELSRHGVDESMLAEACISAHVGAWYLRRKMNKYGNTWRAIAAYHSETPHLGEIYVERIKLILKRWSIIPKNTDSSASTASVNEIGVVQK